MPDGVLKQLAKTPAAYRGKVTVGKKGEMAKVARLTDDEKKVCLRCGACLAVCPVYKKKLVEMVAPRGKMALAESLAGGEIDSEHGVASYLSQCLVCTACMDECPNELDFDARMIAARSVLKTKKAGNLPFIAAFRTVLQTRSLMNLGAFLGRALRRLFFFKVPSESGMHLRFPIVVPKDRLLPKIASQPFLSSAVARSQSALEDAPHTRSVAYFVGCMANYSWTEVPLHLLRLMPKDPHLIVPLKQKCCGMPAIICGDLVSARRLARHNIEVLLQTGAEMIVTTCGSCGSAIKHYYPILFRDDPQMLASAQAVASRIIDVSELLVDVLGQTKFSVNKKLLERLGLDPAKPVRVTYHEPCHLGRRMKVVTQPKTILNNTAGLKFVPMQDENVCCGCGGLFSVHHYDISRAIAADKAKNILATGADIVATGCPACAMQIADGLAHIGRNIPVVHTIELISAE
ncbi:MAG: hypothetical protein DRH70_03275 [Candidatus Coatesbacteria bacterium]|nr:MAG: hypothetical protein DRH70_03275 [Candidatus Coatesbacteria bacterium]